MTSRAFDLGPVACPLCGLRTRRRSRFFEAFPDRFGDDAAFPLRVTTPPVPSWLMTECQLCAGVSPLPYPDELEIANYYLSAEEANDWEIDHYVRLDLNPKAMEGVEELAEKLTRLGGGSGRYLEVGCGSGWTVRAVEQHGWEAVGIEAAPKFARFARDHVGIDVHENTLDQIDLDDLGGPFDVIAAFDVLEHLHDPARDLTILSTIAAPDARIVVALPNIGSPMARWYGLRWRQILPSHINLFTEKSIHALFGRCGWEVVEISEPRYWDPDPERQRTGRHRERLKFAARVVLSNLFVRPALRFPALQRWFGLVSLGRLPWDHVLYLVGDQPTLGDVALVVARPIESLGTASP